MRRSTQVIRAVCQFMVGMFIAHGVLAEPLPSFQNGQRLSHWLLGLRQDLYFLGLSWQVPQEKQAQVQLRQQLLAQLADGARNGRDWPLASRALWREWLLERPVTGRVILTSPEPAWLLVNPQQDPVLMVDQSLVLPDRPSTVTVLLDSGQYCQPEFTPNADALTYLRSCLGEQSRQIDWVWVVQPDGHSRRVGVAAWNLGPQDSLAPGTWLWAPSRKNGVDEVFSQNLARFLGTQGPAPDGALKGLLWRPTTAMVQAAQPRRELPLSSSNWGTLGLLQTPSARMAPVGDFRVHASSVNPYTRLNVFMQPFDWLEAGFRYTDIANVPYWPGYNDQSYKDKSFDFKLRLLQEQAHLPQVALGMIDVGGTGLFSSEYLVGNKRMGNFDFSLGLAWGYLGARGNVKNPLSVFNPSWNSRDRQSSAQGGTVNTGRMFTGPAAWFGGLQWHSPWDPLTFKIEHDGNHYRQEPFGNPLAVRSPWNAGVVYRLSPTLDFSLGYERGTTWMAGLTLRTSLSALGQAKPLDPPVPTWRPQAPPQSDLGRLPQSLEAATGWRLMAMNVQGPVAQLRLAVEGTTYVQHRLDLVSALLHEHLSDQVQTFDLHLEEAGLTLLSRRIDRAAYVLSRNQAWPVQQRPLVAQTVPAPAADQGLRAPLPAAQAWQFGLGPSFSAILGGPDAFVLYKAGVAASARYRFSEATRLNAELDVRMVDNYDVFRYTGPSELPRVRTLAREYEIASSIRLPQLQLSHVRALPSDHFVSVYAGYLESMYAGVGAEWLHRPIGSRLAWGADINQVQQRAFEQDLRLRDYRVMTGHLNLYWDTGWEDVMLKAHAGQYLAGDRGLTLDVSRRFANGVEVGAFATKTNVSSSQFGEGSFDKGLFVRVPFDAMLPRSSNGKAQFTWRPLTRDGGARLVRSSLFELTSLRDPRALQWAPTQK